MASSAPRRSSLERSLRGEGVAGDAGLVDVAVNGLAVAPLTWGLALAVRFGVAPGPVGGPTPAHRQTRAPTCREGAPGQVDVWASSPSEPRRGTAGQRVSIVR